MPNVGTNPKISFLSKHVFHPKWWNACAYWGCLAITRQSEIFCKEKDLSPKCTSCSAMSEANVYSVPPGGERQKLKHSHECQLWAFSCWCMTRSREGGRENEDMQSTQVKDSHWQMDRDRYNLINIIWLQLAACIILQERQKLKQEHGNEYWMFIRRLPVTNIILCVLYDLMQQDAGRELLQSRQLKNMAATVIILQELLFRQQRQPELAS